MSYCHLTPFERGRLRYFTNKGITHSFDRPSYPGVLPPLVENCAGLKVSPMQPKLHMSHAPQARKLVGRKSKTTPELLELIQQKLQDTGHPEQIVGRLLSGKLCFKTIYRWIYSGILPVDLEVLRQKGKRRKPVETRGKFHLGTSIHQRPKEVRKRTSIGHWEAKSHGVLRGESKGCFATFAEKKKSSIFSF